MLEAGNADEALEIIQHGAVTIDLVFSDVVMPGSMDGFGLAKWIRANRPGLPIILTSGDAAKADGMSASVKLATLAAADNRKRRRLDGSWSSDTRWFLRLTNDCDVARLLRPRR